MALKNIAGQRTTTTGVIGAAATISLDGAALDNHNTLAGAGCVSGEQYTVGVKDGTATQLSRATFNTGAPDTLTINSVIASTNGGAAITLSGSAEVYIDAAAEDIQQPPAEGPFVDGDKTKLDGIETINPIAAAIIFGS